MCTPGWRAAVWPLKAPLPWAVAAVHGPCQVSTWNQRLSGLGAKGAKLLSAVKLNAGVELLVTLPASAVISPNRGMGWTCCSSMTVTVVLGKLTTGVLLLRGT